tara:strand:- start:2546 stop:3985 length:1440 start_codon:yes stop_codon:yes gene_type:complete
MPSPALAALKSCVQNAGYNCYTIDLNIELYDDLKQNHKVYGEVDNYFQTDFRYLSQDISDLEPLIEMKYSLSDDALELYQKHLNRWADYILDQGNEWIGISLLSVNSVLYTIDLAEVLKNKSSNCKIVLGGPGVSTFGIMGASNLGEFMIVTGLADRYLTGEGEYSLVELLNDKEYIEQGQIDNLDILPYPDYSDFDFAKYDSQQNTVAVTGSRGCVRSCAFCDIKSAWKKYRYRSGISIANEIINHHQRFGSTEFRFTDSLVNGSLKAFEEFLDAIILAKKQGLIANNIKWSGQFICRPINQFTEEWFEKMSLAGANMLQIGVESGSEAVMHNMGKKLSNDDIDFTIGMLSKYKIQCDLLMIVGYPTETDEDFDMTLNLLERLSPYNEQGCIEGINLGKTMVVLPGSPIGENMNHWGIEYDDNNNWISTLNPTLTFKQRVKRRVLAQEKCQELGYMIRWPLTTLRTLSENLKLNKETA